MNREIKDLGIHISDGNYSSKYPRSEEFVKEGVPFIRANNLVNGEVTDEDMYFITPEKHAILLKGHLQEGDVLITTRGNIGQVGIVPKRHIDSNINAQLVLLRTNPKELYNRYLLWALQSQSVKKQYQTLQTGTALKQLPVGKLEQVSIKVTDIISQHNIADNLDKIYKIINDRKKELNLLDDLIKARFVEMFGDYRTNNREFETHCGSELFKFSSGKFLPESKRFYDGVPVYGGNGIAFFTDEPLIDYPTVIIGRVGAWCGNVRTVIEPVWITDNAIFIKEFKTNKFTLEFITELMQVMDFHQYADFSGQPKITQKPLENLSYLTPPLEMQNEFTDFVKQIDKSKFNVNYW